MYTQGKKEVCNSFPGTQNQRTIEKQQYVHNAHAQCTELPFEIMRSNDLCRQAILQDGSMVV